MLDALSKSLLARYRQRQLGHFYILRASDGSQLNQWMHEFLVSVLSDEGRSRADSNGRLERGHPDILWLKPLDQSYKIENGDFDPLFQTMAHRPLELPWRFIIIEKPDSISDVYANKLLKTLEEPSPATSIIFLHDAARPLMATIESRGIKISLPQLSATQPHLKVGLELADFLQQWCAGFPDYYDEQQNFSSDNNKIASELSSLAKSKAWIEENLVNGLLNWAQQNVKEAAVLDNIIQQTKHANSSRQLHNSVHERFHTLVHSIRPHR